MSNTDLLFAGTSLKGLAGVIVTDWTGLWTGLFRRGQYDTIANRNGAFGSALPLDQFNFSITVYIEGDTEAAMFSNLTAVASALTGSGGLGTLERRIDNGLGGYTSSYAAGAFAGVSPTLFNHDSGQIDLTFGNLSGGWFSDSGLTTRVPI